MPTSTGQPTLKNTMTPRSRIHPVALPSLMLGLLLSLSQAALADARTAAKPAPKEEAKAEAPIEIDDRDPAMQAAFRKARASLDGFLKVHEQASEEVNMTSVRIKRTEGKREEYVWIHPFERDGKGFKGKVNSEPSQLKKLTVGSEVRFQRADIADWMYYNLKQRKIYGNFTTCVQLAKATAAEVESLKKAYGLDCSANQ